MRNTSQPTQRQAGRQKQIFTQTKEKGRDKSRRNGHNKGKRQIKYVQIQRETYKLTLKEINKLRHMITREQRQERNRQLNRTGRQEKKKNRELSTINHIYRQRNKEVT